jgi:hypothetical protein
MLQLYWDDMPPLKELVERLAPWGTTVLIGSCTVRLIPDDLQYPTTYFYQSGAIDVMISGLDLFERDDCVERLKQWLSIS